MDWIGQPNRSAVKVVAEHFPSGAESWPAHAPAKHAMCPVHWKLGAKNVAPWESGEAMKTTVQTFKFNLQALLLSFDALAWSWVAIQYASLIRN